MAAISVVLMADAALEEEERVIYRRIRGDGFVLPDAEFLRQYRMTKVKVEALVKILTPKLLKERPQGLYMLTVQDEVLVTLLFYDSGSFQHSLASNYEHGMSQPSVSRSIGRVTDAINATMRHYIRFPTGNAEVEAIKASFRARCVFPDVLGAIDCTHRKNFTLARAY